MRKCVPVDLVVVDKGQKKSLGWSCATDTEVRKSVSTDLVVFIPLCVQHTD
jgi:hypothetical protein